MPSPGSRHRATVRGRHQPRASAVQLPRCRPEILEWGSNRHVRLSPLGLAVLRFPVSPLRVKAMAWRARVQRRDGPSPRCEYRCLERCLRVGPPAQTGTKPLLQIRRALAKRSVCCPDLRFQPPPPLRKLHRWLFLLSVLAARARAGRELAKREKGCPLSLPPRSSSEGETADWQGTRQGSPCLAPWMSLRGKLAVGRASPGSRQEVSPPR